MCVELGCNDMLQWFAQDACERHWAVAYRVSPGTFLENGVDTLLFPISWDLTLVKCLLVEVRYDRW